MTELPSSDEGGHVFLSHASARAEDAARLCEELEARGMRCWIAPRDIPCGADWPATLERAISTANAFVLLLSREADQSEDVRKEVDLAAQRKVRLMVASLEPTQLTGGLAYQLARVHARQLVGPRRRAEFELLVRDLRDPAAGDLVPPQSTKAGAFTLRLIGAAALTVLAAWLTFGADLGRPVILRGWAGAAWFATVALSVVAFGVLYAWLRMHPRPRPWPAFVAYGLALAGLGTGWMLERSCVFHWQPSAVEVGDLIGEGATGTDDELDLIRGPVLVQRNGGAYDAAACVPWPSWLGDKIHRYLAARSKNDAAVGEDFSSQVMDALKKDPAGFLQERLLEFERDSAARLALLVVGVHLLTLLAFAVGHAYALAVLERGARPGR